MTQGIGWYISDTHARRAIGYLSGSVPELRRVPVPHLASAWGEALEKTILAEERSPIGPEVATPSAPGAHIKEAWELVRSENYEGPDTAHLAEMYEELAFDRDELKEALLKVITEGRRIDKSGTSDWFPFQIAMTAAERVTKAQAEQRRSAGSQEQDK